MNVIEIIENAEKVNRENIKNLFGPLDLSKKIDALSIFLQVKHNNLFLEALWKLWSEFFDIEIKNHDYQENKVFFDQLYHSHSINKFFIVKGLEFIPQKATEFCRWTAILCGINGDIEGRESYLALGYKIWEISDKGEAPAYSFNLIKTKIDLLIYSKNYFEATKLCEESLEIIEIHGVQKACWLKYQFATTLIGLSKHVYSNFNIDILTDQLEQMEKDAESEELDIDNQ